MASKYRQVKVNLLPADYEKMKDIAEQFDCTIASLFRDLAIMQIDNPPSKKGGVKSHSVAPELLYQVKKIGANLNQVSHKCNIEKSVDRLVYQEMIEIRKELEKLLKNEEPEE